MRHTTPIFLILSVVSLLSSCITSFNVGQDAETLRKHTLQPCAQAGIVKLGVGVRYGFLDKLDGGIYYSCDALELIFPVSGDVKWELLGSPEKHYVISTGAGIGTGVERSVLWNESQPHILSEDAWYNYAGMSLDGYLPLYLSGYVRVWDLHLSLTYNPYLVYRYGFYDKIHDSSYYNNYHYDFRTMNKGLIGNAFSLMISNEHFYFAGTINSQKYWHNHSSPNLGHLEDFQAYLSLGYKFSLVKKVK